MEPGSEDNAMTRDSMILRWLRKNPQQLRQTCKKIAMYTTMIIPVLFFMNFIYAYFKSIKEEDFCLNEHDQKFIAVNYTCQEIKRTFTNHIYSSFWLVVCNIIMHCVQIFVMLFPKHFDQNNSLKQSMYFLACGTFQLYTTVFMYFYIFKMQVFNKCDICCIIYEPSCTKGHKGACLPRIAGQLNYWFCLTSATTFLLSSMSVVSSLICLLVDMHGQPKQEAPPSESENRTYRRRQVEPRSAMTARNRIKRY